MQRQAQVSLFLNYTHVHDSHPMQRFRREISVWSRLNHKNVLPLLGIITEFSPLPSMVSPWMNKGSLNMYLKFYESSLNIEARLAIVRVCFTETVSRCQAQMQLRDIAEGLQYREPTLFFWFCI